MSMIRKMTFAAVLAVLATPAMADCDTEAGEKAFRKCKSCHQVGEGAESRLGPVLNGIVGSNFAAVEGFKYSDAILARQAEGAVWTEEELDAFLAKPKKYLKGTKMSFAGVRKEKDRANLICYLKGFD